MTEPMSVEVIEQALKAEGPESLGRPPMVPTEIAEFLLAELKAAKAEGRRAGLEEAARYLGDREWRKTVTWWDVRIRSLIDDPIEYSPEEA